MTTQVSNTEALQLLAEHIGVSVDDLKFASEKKYEQKRIERLAAQIQAEKAKEAALLEKAHKQFNDMWQTGQIICRIDGKLIQKPGDICKNGTPDQKEMDHLIMAVKNIHGHLVMNFKGGVTGSPDARRAATLSKRISCSCGRDHQVEVFISSNSE